MLDGSRIVTIQDLGRRIAEMRIRLGKTQADLGADVNLSPGYISKIERGEKDGFPVGLLLAMADALDARMEIVCDAEEDDVKEQDSELILPMRRLLLPIPQVAQVGGSVDDTELTPAKLRRRVLDATADFNKARYAKLAAEVPALVTSIEAAIGLHEGEAKENLSRLLAHAFILTAQTLTHLRSEDLATHAIRQAMDAAENAGDPVLRASAGENYIWAFERQEMYDDAETIAVAMAAEIEPSMTKAPPQHLAVWGRILRLGSRAAARNNRPDIADELLRLAHSAAVRIDGGRLDYGRYWAVFNSTMVGATKAENALASGDAELALRIGSEVHQTKELHLDTWLRHLCCTADAQTATRDDAGAIETLKSIRGLAPEWIKNSRGAHDVVIKLLGKVSSRRARSSGLAELAAFMNVQP